MFVRKFRVSTILGALISAVLVVTVLAACGAQGGSQSPQPATSTKASESSKPVESAKPSAAATKEPVKIGTIFTMTGPQGSNGVNTQTGTKMAVEEINAAGGIMGRPVELIERDDAGDPTKTLTAAQELVEKQGVTLILGTNSSSQALAILPYLTDQKVVSIGSQTADAAVDPKKYPYGFAGSPLSSVQAAIVIKYPVEVLKLKKIGLLVDGGAYGNSMLGPYTKELQDRGLTPVAVERYTYGGTDMSAQLANLKKAGAEAIVSSSLGADSIRILKNLQSMGWDVPYCGGGDLNSASVVKGAGPDAIKQAYAYSQKQLAFSAKMPTPAKTKAFADKLAKRLNQSPLQDSIVQQSLFYDQTFILKWAVEKAQSTEGPKVAAALETLTGWDGAHAAIKFSKDNHSGVGLDELVMIKIAGLKDGVFELAPGY